MALELVKICPRSFLLQVPEAQVSWLFNAWPDIVKYMVQQERQFNGLVYPDLRLQTDKGISAKLIEFPLLYALFIKGMIFRGEKPSLIGTPHQLKLACEGFRRGLYGFYDVAEMEGCDLTEKEAAAVMREIEGMAFGGIQPVENTIELVELKPLEEMPGHEVVTES
jgi:hypothetical protein